MKNKFKLVSTKLVNKYLEIFRKIKIGSSLD